MKKKKVCVTCKYGLANELGDLICVNADSENVADFVEPEDTCKHWQQYEKGFENDSTRID